ncbi:MAG: VOC family protein, partial [Pseudonocardiaceae bacterium]
GHRTQRKDMAVTSYPPGTPTWFDLGSPDVAASARFYSDLFGWTAIAVSDPGAGGYTTFMREGKLAAAVADHQIDTPYHRPYGPDQQQGMPAIWTVYFATDDADALTQRAVAAGGEIIMSPMEVLGLGRMAVFADPAGAAFAVWQSISMDGAEVIGQPRSVNWVELVTRDIEGAKAFYGQVFGMAAKDLSRAGLTDPIWQIGGQSVAGTRDLSTTQAARPHWALTFGVEHCDAAARRAVELGGTTENPPADTPLGRRADLVDPHGAGFSVLAKAADFPGSSGRSS